MSYTVHIIEPGTQAAEEREIKIQEMQHISKTLHLTSKKPYLSRSFYPFRHSHSRYTPRHAPGVQANLSFDSAPLPALIGGAALVISMSGYLVYEAIKTLSGGGNQQPQQSNSTQPQKERALPRENAVLVFGASGRSGRELVFSLLTAGRTVIAAVRSVSRAKEAFQPLGITEGLQKNGSSGILFLQGGVDITNSDTLTADLFQGATQIVCSVGAVFGRTADGQMGYLDNLTPERVDAEGVSHIATAAAKHLFGTTKGQQEQLKPRMEVLAMKTEQDISVWQRLDDIIMGGQSSSIIEPSEDGQGAVWSGDLIVEGGGFCGARTAAATYNLKQYDGIALRVKSNAGQTFKLNIKTVDQENVPEDTYQATFDTVSGQWTDVFIPWRNFVLSRRAKTVPASAASVLDPSAIRQFGLVYSRFEFNGYANPRYSPGPFELCIESGIKAYTEDKPQIVLISSAGVERNAKIGDDEAARKADIPIIQLNPGAILNHKYAGENAVRASGLSYTILRPTGLTQEEEDVSHLIEAKQGDMISGKITRSELAATVAAAVNAGGAAVNKTMELRRVEAAGDKGKSMSPTSYLQMFLGAVEDRLRTRVGMEPFPAPAPPPAPVSAERKKEILADERVKKSISVGGGGRVREEEEAAEAKTVTVTSDGREGTVAAAAAAPEYESTDGVPDNVQDAREWVKRWRSTNLEKQLLPKEEEAMSV